MDTQTEHVLKEVAKVRNVSEDGELKQKAVRYLTHNEKQSRLGELEQLKRLTDQPTYVQGAITGEGRAALGKRKRQIEKDLQAGSPPELTGAAKDALAQREAQLEADIRVGMLTTEEMRRNPATAVDRHRKWDRANKDKILEWKNIRRALNPDSDEKDLANIERLRPTMLPMGMNATSTFMADAQIPGKFAMTPTAKQNWPLGEPKVNTPLKQAAKREASEATKAARAAGLARAREVKAAKKAQDSVSVVVPEPISNPLESL